MRKSLFIVFAALGSLLYAQESTTFILVRHAEKVSDGSKDPALSTDGEERAQRFMEMFKETPIDVLLSTDFKRTRMTVEPLAQAKELDITVYNWGNPEELVNAWLKEYTGKTVLVSGHSNTTPFLANALLGGKPFEQFDDSDYGNILIVTAFKSGSGKLVHLRF